MNCAEPKTAVSGRLNKIELMFLAADQAASIVIGETGWADIG